MSEFQTLTVQGLQSMMQNNDRFHIIDIRDPESYHKGHIQDAVHITNDNLQHFVDQAEFEEPIVVVCYHGISSQKVAQYFLELGFDEVYSLNGGYEAWAQASL